MTTLTALVEKVYEEAVRPLAPAEQRRLAEYILAKCQACPADSWPPGDLPSEGDSTDAFLARLDRAFPGTRPATKHKRDIQITPVPLLSGRDLMEILSDVRDDRDYLRRRELHSATLAWRWFRPRGLGSLAAST